MYRCGMCNSKFNEEFQEVQIELETGYSYLECPVCGSMEVEEVKEVEHE